MPNSLHHLARLFVTSVGIGYSPLLPGTLASLVGLLLYLFVFDTPLLYVVTVGSLFGFGLWASHLVLQEAAVHDPSWIVLDEVVGMLIALFGVFPKVPHLILGFVLFRFFDSVKVWPLNRLEQLKGEWGIFMDDVGAALYSNLVLHLFLRLTS